MLPPLLGRPIRVEVRRSLGPKLAACSIPRRLILLDAEVLANRGDFERILVHEVFHFAWVRLSNPARRSWEQLLEAEFGSGARGELGWSAERLKSRLKPTDPRRRTAAWRRYACESFCDSAAWAFAELRSHDEFTLPVRFRRLRRAWFHESLPESGPIPV